MIKYIIVCLKTGLTTIIRAVGLYSATRKARLKLGHNNFGITQC